MKNEDIHIRISKELKDAFVKKCERLSINKSKWFRQQIEKFLKEDTK
jgi:predicted DNA-binding protein